VAVLVVGLGGRRSGPRVVTFATARSATGTATRTSPTRPRPKPRPAPAKPNVAVDAKSIAWRTADAGCTVSYSLRNDSRVDAPGTETTVSFVRSGGSGALVRTVEPAELAPGELHVGNASVPRSPGARRGEGCRGFTEIAVAADPQNVLAESDEGDNRASVRTGGEPNGPRGLYYAPDDTRSGAPR
jgi:hypothetical protein